MRSHSGLMHPWSTRYLICWCVPPEVALEMAHAASLDVKFGVREEVDETRMMLLSIMAWI